jgi:hypothetical protein
MIKHVNVEGDAMYGEKPILTTARFTLMCRDHEAATFVWNVPERRVMGRIKTIEAAYLPWGAIDHKGNTNRKLMARWIAGRSIPALRPRLLGRLRAIGIEDADMLLALSGGSSLSDQYWLRREGSSLTWDDVSFYVNGFDPRLGQYLTSQDSQSTDRLAQEIARDLHTAVISPDSSLGGNLPKRWEIRRNQRVLVKRSLSAYG